MAPAYAWLSCDADGSLWEWRYRPRYDGERWDALTKTVYNTGKPLRGAPPAGQRVPAPGECVEVTQ